MTNSEQLPPVGRTILNANQGVTNIIERDVIERDMGGVTDKIFSILKKHYGPYSAFAGVDPNRPLEDTVFTKDGANIITSVSFASPLEDWVRKTVAYIGKKMETAAGDGTTSAMMFTCGMLKYMTETLDAIKPVSYYEMTTAYKSFVHAVKDVMKNFTITAKRGGQYDRDLVRELVRMQTLTSSHGNAELAEAIADMFYKLPPDMWSKITFQRRRYESDVDIEVVETKHQYTVLDCEIMSKTVYNKDTGRYLEYPDATLIVINGRVMLDSPTFGDIVEKQVEAATKEHPVVIFCTNDFDNATFGRLMEYTTQGKSLAVFTVEVGHPTINDFTILQAITGANVMEYSGGEFADRPLIVEHVYVKHENRVLELDNLYKDEREPSEVVRERPYYNDSSKPYYREFCDTIKKHIEAKSHLVETAMDQRELNELQRMYNKLVFDKNLTLVIGGKTFDNLAMFDVVDDALRASIRSLENGAVVSNSKTLYNSTKAVLESVNQLIKTAYQTKPGTVADHSQRYAKRKYKLIAWFAANVLCTLEEFPAVVMDQLYPAGSKTIEGYERKPSMWQSFRWWVCGCQEVRDTLSVWGITDIGSSMPVIPTKEEIELLHKFTPEERKKFCEWWFSHSVNVLTYDNTRLWDDQGSETQMSFKHILRREYVNNSLPMIIQPANADIDMLERFGEIAIKFVLTDRVIVKDSAYVNDKKDTRK